MIKSYKAIIIEEDNKVKDVLYECNKKANKECSKTYCGKPFCEYTKNKEYAINYHNCEKAIKD